MRTQSTPEERFWAKVDRNGPVPEHCQELGACWVWTGGCHAFGYGIFHFRVDEKRKTWLTHRVSYVMEYGAPPPEKPCILHKCDNPPCVRPEHLFPGTRRDNVIDRIRKGRSVYPSFDDRTLLMVSDFVSGKRSAPQIAAYYGMPVRNVYAYLRSHRVTQIVGGLTTT